MKQPKKPIFLCYSSRDRRFVDKLHKDLSSLGVPIWLDRIEMKAGDSLIRRIGGAISDAEFVVAVISPNSINSPWVQKELEIAITRQIKEQQRLVIPLLRRSCELPPFLHGQIHIDFQDPRKYGKNLEALLSALEDEHREATKRPAESLMPDGQVFVDKISEKLGNDDWVEQFKTLPLTNALVKALQLNSFSGQGAELIRIGLIMTSHAGGGITFNNLCALIGFLKDAENRDVRKPEYFQFLTSMIEDKSIEETYRWFMASSAVRIFKTISNRRLRLSFLPEIFPPDSYDPLADHLIQQFLETQKPQESILGMLWNSGSIAYRDDIFLYAARTNRWREPRRIPSDLTSNSSPRVLWRALHSGWLGPQLHESVNPITLEEALNAKPFSVNGFISAIEDFSRMRASNDSSAALSLVDFSIDALRTIRQQHGVSAAFTAATALIASPFTDLLTSSLTLFFCTQTFGIDSLEYDKRFPGCLLVPKRGDFLDGLPALSVLGGLVEAAQGDDAACALLIQLLCVFKIPSIYAAVDLQIKALPDIPSSLVEVRKFLYGDITFEQLEYKLKEEL